MEMMMIIRMHQGCSSDVMGEEEEQGRKKTSDVIMNRTHMGL